MFQAKLHQCTWSNSTPWRHDSAKLLAGPLCKDQIRISTVPSFTSLTRHFSAKASECTWPTLRQRCSNLLQRETQKLGSPQTTCSDEIKPQNGSVCILSPKLESEFERCHGVLKLLSKTFLRFSRLHWAHALLAQNLACEVSMPNQSALENTFACCLCTLKKKHAKAAHSKRFGIESSVVPAGHGSFHTFHGRIKRIASMMQSWQQQKTNQQRRQMSNKFKEIQIRTCWQLVESSESCQVACAAQVHRIRRPDTVHRYV